MPCIGDAMSLLHAWCELKAGLVSSGALNYAIIGKFRKTQPQLIAPVQCRPCVAKNVFCELPCLRGLVMSRCRSRGVLVITETCRGIASGRVVGSFRRERCSTALWCEMNVGRYRMTRSVKKACD